VEESLLALAMTSRLNIAKLALSLTTALATTAFAQEADTCDESKWPDLKKVYNGSAKVGLVCSDCKVLVKNFKTYETCGGYCKAVGMPCAGAWEEHGHTCEVSEEKTCGQSWPTNDAICACVNCEVPNKQLGGWTFVRYIVLMLITAIKVFSIWKNGNPVNTWEDVMKIKAFQTHPVLTKRMRQPKTGPDLLNFCWQFFWCGIIFIQSEGVGFVIYFGSSAMMDNLAIYGGAVKKYCEYTTQFSLYSMALISFIPCCAVAYYLQGRWYDNGDWCPDKGKVGKCTKILFIGLMVFMSCVSFMIRLGLVYFIKPSDTCFADMVDNFLDKQEHRVLIAAVAPPLVDAIQTISLIAASALAPLAKTAPLTNALLA
jgi:hypothetical protein